MAAILYSAEFLGFDSYELYSGIAYWGHFSARMQHEALYLNAICPKLGALLPSGWAFYVINPQIGALLPSTWGI